MNFKTKVEENIYIWTEGVLVLTLPRKDPFLHAEFEGDLGEKPNPFLNFLFIFSKYNFGIFHLVQPFLILFFAPRIPITKNTTPITANAK
jgi:hypothetical protein